MAFVLNRPPATDDELWTVVRKMWGVVLPRHTCGNPGHTAPFQAFADAYFGRNGTIVLWHGSRGLSGKSFMLSILGLTKAFITGSDVNLLGGSLAQSANIHEHMRMAMDHENCPRYMILTESQKLIHLSNKARIQPLTASQKTVRGPHPPFLLLDEIDEMDLKILNAALGQPLPQPNWLGVPNRPYTVMCSTWQNPEGTFTAKMREFEEKGQPIVQWCYKCSANPIDGWLEQETIEAKMNEIPAEMWRVEYELGEPSIGNRAFDSEAVEKAFGLPFDKDEMLLHKVSKDYEEYRFAEYERDGQYVAAADWGKERDYTVISVHRTDQDRMELVYYLRVNRRPYPQMIGWFNDAIVRYQATAIHDATGLGNVVGDYVDTRARNFIMTGEKRSGMLTEYVNAVEKGGVLAPRIKTAYLAHKYCQVGDLYKSGQEFHLPDEVCSFALAWKASGKRAVVGPITIQRDGTPTKLERAFMHPESVMDVVIKDQVEPGSISLLV